MLITLYPSYPLVDYKAYSEFLGVRLNPHLGRESYLAFVARDDSKVPILADARGIYWLAPHAGTDSKWNFQVEETEYANIDLELMYSGSQWRVAVVYDVFTKALLELRDYRGTTPSDAVPRVSAWERLGSV